MPAPAETADLALALHWLMPLHFFYEKNEAGLPDFQFTEKAGVPYPYRSMLCHENDMTPTLAAFHHSNLYLEVLEREIAGDYLLRCVILRSKASDVPVEFGAIGIHLNTFTPEVREHIEKGAQPLGGILGEFGVPHTGSPSAFFSVPADRLISDALAQPEGTTMWGRCNQLLDPDGIAMADIVEILPRNDESENWVKNVS